MVPLYITYSQNAPILTWLPYPGSIKYQICRGIVKTKLVKIAETTALQFADISNEANVMEKQDRAKFFYQINSVDIDGNIIPFSDIQTLNPDDIGYPFLGVYQTLVSRHENILLSNIGETVDYYLKKGSGTRCPNYDPVTHDVSGEAALCPICFNTAYVGGFEKIQTNLKVLNAPDSLQETQLGYVLTGTKKGRISSYPITANGDFFRNKSGEIYLIGNVVHKKIKNLLLYQTFDLTLLFTTHPYYSINL